MPCTRLATGRHRESSARASPATSSASARRTRRAAARRLARARPRPELQDITTTFLAWSGPGDYAGTTEVITPAIVPAAAYRIPLERWRAELTVAASAESRFDNRGDATHARGAFSATSYRAELASTAALPARRIQRGLGDQEMTAGAGFRLAAMTVDYAYAGDTLGNDEETHRISITAH